MSIQQSGATFNPDGSAPLPTSTPAELKIDALFADSQFMARYTHHDLRIRAQAMAEMEALAKLAAAARR